MQRLFAVALLLAASAVAPAFDLQDLHEETVIAANWQQLSGEYDAYLYQTFNSAHSQLEEALKKVPKGKKPAIVTDIDDTLIDGTLYFTSLVGTNDIRSVQRSRYWWNHQTVEALPGAVEFFQYAHKQDIAIFYISGRFNDVKSVTYDNLSKQGFPVSSKEHILLQSADNTTRSKEIQRQSIENKGYHIIMLMGDQLDDLAEVTPKLTQGKKDWVHRNQNLFGEKWFIFPNTVYGSWESAIAPDYKSMLPIQKHQARIDSLYYKTNYLNTSDPTYASHLLLADVWRQSADYQAAAYQAFNQAGRVLQQREGENIKNPAIVVDIDGTILDYIPMYSSPMHKDSIRDNRYALWFLKEMEHARPIPGALEFLNSASNQGYEIFYVSARPQNTGRPGKDNDIEIATVNKLARHGFPQANAEHVMLRNEYCPATQIPCGKEFKRTAITSGKVNGTRYQITMLVGDLLTDFDFPEQELPPFEKSTVKNSHSLFGNKYIIIPNTVSTSWMRYTYSKEAGRNYSELTQQEQAQIRRRLVRDWEGKNEFKKVNSNE